VSSDAVPPLKTYQVWLVLIIASVGFLFDTYELLMLPVIAAPAISELLGVPPNNPDVRSWISTMSWLSALCAGVFGLLGGWLIDRFGRKRIMVASILLYSFSPVAASFSPDVQTLVFFRCTTFIGVCVEFVAAITWLAELFPDKRKRELAIGWTQAFASVGGLLVTGANQFAVSYADSLPSIPVRVPLDPNASWRYTLITGLIPGLLILVLLPFVPESRIWVQRKLAGTLRRPSFAELFTPALRRTTIVTAILSACAYAAAFGALQFTPTQVVPGLGTLQEERTALGPLRKEATELNHQFNEMTPKLREQEAAVPGLADVVNDRTATRREMRKLQERIDTATRHLKEASESERASLEERIQTTKEQLPALQQRLKELTQRLDEVTAGHPDAKKIVTDRESLLAKIGANRAKQKEPDDVVKAHGNAAQLWQESGGLVGRIILAVLIVVVASRRVLLRLFQVPGLVLFPLTYVLLYREAPDSFVFGIFLCGLLTVGQFSYFGEYLPKAFPLHLRGTGGSFATNVGGRMIGTSGSLVTGTLLAPLMPGDNYTQVATAAAITGTSVFLIGLIASFWLPEPKDEEAPNLPVATSLSSADEGTGGPHDPNP
jgi:MFS family permease